MQHNSGQPQQQAQNMSEVLRAMIEQARIEGMQEGMQQTAANAAGSMTPFMQGAREESMQEGAQLGAAAGSMTPFMQGAREESMQEGMQPSAPGAGTKSIGGPSAFGMEIPNLIEVLHALLKAPSAGVDAAMKGASETVSTVGEGLKSGMDQLTGASRQRPTNAAREQQGSGNEAFFDQLAGKKRFHTTYDTRGASTRSLGETISSYKKKAKTRQSDLED